MSEITEVRILCKGTKTAHKEEFVARVRLPTNPGSFGVTRVEISNRINAASFENDFETGEIITHQKTPGGASGDSEHDRVDVHCPYVDTLTGKRCGVNLQLKNASKAREKFDTLMLALLDYATTLPENNKTITLSEVASRI